MHVLYVIDSLVPGGAESSLAALAPHYATRGVHLDVAYLHDRPGLQAELEEAGATLFCLKSGGGRAGWTARAGRLISTRRPDLVHTTLFDADVTGRVAARLCRVPVVSSLVNVTYGPEHYADPNLIRWKLRTAQAVDALTARLVRRFHAVSGEVAEAMGPRLRTPRSLIEVIPRGREPRLLGRRHPARSAEARARLGVAPRDPVVFAAARQERQKGLDVLVRAFPAVLRAHPDACLVVAGREGDQTRDLVELVSSGGLAKEVRFLGARKDVYDLMCAADVFVAPSRWEGMPGTVLEAMALEAPIVASDIPTVREAVGEETALLFRSGDVDSLGAAISEVLSDRKAALSRTSAARERFLERFTIDRIAERMVAFYERALAV